MEKTLKSTDGGSIASAWKIPRKYQNAREFIFVEGGIEFTKRRI